MRPEVSWPALPARLLRDLGNGRISGNCLTGMSRRFLPQVEWRGGMAREKDNAKAEGNDEILHKFAFIRQSQWVVNGVDY